MSSGVVYCFGPFELHTRAHDLTRDGARLPVSELQLRVLSHLVTAPGVAVSKNDLIAAGWAGVAVTDNSLEQVISTLRRLLGDRPGAGPYIETVSRQGYRFSGEVVRRVERTDDDGIEAILAPHRRWVEGRAALETLAVDQVAQARALFEALVRTAPDQAAARVGLANACVMQFELSRTGGPDRATLASAVEHAREACRLDPHWGETWATLAFVLARTGAVLDAIAAARHATTLEPDNWRHHLRHSAITWGEERLRGARRALALLPGLALGHWLAATVQIARHAFPEAERELDAGIVSLESHRQASSRLSAVGLYWLKGLLRRAAGDVAGALAALHRELSFEADGHIYARDCCAQAWYGIGAIRLREGDVAGAVAAFDETLARVPSLPLAVLGRALATGSSTVAPNGAMLAGGVDAAIASAAALKWHGRSRDAAAIVSAALAQAPAGNAGWLLPVDALLDVRADDADWATVLAMLGARAA